MRRFKKRRARRGGVDKELRALKRKILQAKDIDEISELIGEDQADAYSLLNTVEDLDQAKAEALELAAEIVEEEDGVDLPGLEVEEEEEEEVVKKRSSDECCCCDRLKRMEKMLSQLVGGKAIDSVKSERSHKPVGVLEGIEKDVTIHAVSAAKKTTVASAKALAADHGVANIPQSGETYILWLTINKLIGSSEHVQRLLRFWRDGKADAKVIRRHCSGRMSHEILQVLGGGKHRSERAAVEEIVTKWL